MITLTQEAQKKVTSMLAEANDDKALRIFIEPGGCSGFEYGMSIDTPKTEDHFDNSFELEAQLNGSAKEHLLEEIKTT